MKPDLNSSAADEPSVDVQERNGVAVVTASGALDFGSAEPLRAALDTVVARDNPRVVLDVSRVTFVDSTGLSLFIIGDRSARDRGGWLRLAGPAEQLRRLLHTTNLESRLDVYDTVAAAVDASGQ